MRWFKWAVVGAWFGFHGWLWTMLPPVPRARLIGTDCRFSADGQHLLTISGKSVREYSVSSGSLTRELRAQIDDTDGAYGWETSAGGRRAVVFNRCGNCVLIDVETGRQTRQTDIGNRVNSIGDNIRLTADGSLSVHYCSQDANITHGLRVCNVETGRARLVELAAQPNQVRIDPEGRFAAVTNRNSDAGKLGVQFIDLATGEECGSDSFLGNEWKLRSGFSPDGKFFAADLSTRDYTKNMESAVFIWDVARAKTVARIADSWFQGWRADGWLVARRWNGGILDVDIDPRSGDQRPVTPQPGVGGVLMDRTGRVLVVDRARMRRLPALVEKILEWLGRPSPDDSWKDIQCCDLAGQELARVPSPNPNVAEISPDGDLLAVQSFGYDGMIDLYDLPPHTPGGIILALMIAEVSLLIAWTAWRRRRHSSHHSGING
jgi:hypothetical protein